MKTLVDSGFDSDYSHERINDLTDLFTSEKVIQNFIDKIHAEDNTLDLKRGEFYPEILRCIISMKRVIAEVFSIDIEQCHPNFGSNGSIDTILTAIKLREINKNIKVDFEGGLLVATPTYFRNYNSANAKQIKMIKVPLKNWNLDIETFLKTLEERKPTVVFLVSPNNPTGIPVADAQIIQIMESVDNKTLVVIDRTLININPEISTKELLARFKNKQLAILHSCSKYLGLSHLRVGFAVYSNKEVANEIQPHLPLGLGVEGAVRATKYMLESRGFKPADSIVKNIIENKKLISSFCLANNDFSVTDFSGNYCILCLPEKISSRKVVLDLEMRGIYTMDGSDFPEPIDGVLRLHVGGRPELMQKTISALEEICI